MLAFGSPIWAETSRPPLRTRNGLDAEIRRLVEHEVGQLAPLDAADVLGDAVGDRRVDRVLGDIALDALVVVARAVAGQRAELHLHLVGGLPGPDDGLADPAHRLRVGAHHADDAAVVKDVLGADRLGPDAALGERHVLGDASRQVMADHQHVEVLVDRVDGERPRGVGARGQDVGQRRRS